MALDLHGAEIVAADQPARTIRVGPSSVIGLVGSAGDAEDAVAARAGWGLGTSALVATAAAAGKAGNEVTVEVVRPDAASSALAVSVDGKAITVSLATGADKSVTTTATLLKTGWDAAAAVVAVATLALGAGAGAGVLAPAARFHLRGGKDAIAPLNEPVLLRTAEDVARLGAAGALPRAVRGALVAAGDAGATVVVSRTTDDADANVLGTLDARAGVYALLKAQAVLGMRPKLIAAPGNQSAGVALGLIDVATRLGGGCVPFCTLDAADYAAAVTAVAKLDAIIAIWPKWVVRDPVTGDEVTTAADGWACGHVARIDADPELGWSASPSNKQVLGAVRTAVPVDWSVGGRNTTANLLNRAHVVTAVRKPGRGLVWHGNRMANGAMIPRERAVGLVDEALLSVADDYVDRRVDEPFVGYVLKRMNALLRRETLARNILGGRAWFDAAKNTADTLAADQVTFSFDIGLLSYSEHVVFDRRISDSYGEALVARLTEEVAR